MHVPLLHRLRCAIARRTSALTASANLDGIMMRRLRRIYRDVYGR